MVKFLSGLDEFVEYKAERRFCTLDQNCGRLLKKICDNHSFMSSFSSLQFGRDATVTRLSTLITPSNILNSAVMTLHSMLICCEYGHFADVITLTRKYRDDLFFYLYIVSVNEINNLFSDEKASKQEENIKKWIDNNLHDLNIGEILSHIASMPHTKDAVRKYNLKCSFDEIGSTLNSYVHGSGISFYNKFVRVYTEKELTIFIDRTIKHLDYITVTFVYLLALCRPISIMSSDYLDYLECGYTPPCESQYWVAPFIKELMSNSAHLLGNDCLKYLREETGMMI